MNENVLSSELRAFILKYLDSIAHLEVLLLVRASPDIQWDVATTAKRLYTSEAQASQVLDRLCADRLLTRSDNAFTYGNLDPKMAQTIDDLANAYARHLIPVTNLIHDKSRRIQEFSNAFRFKREQ
jgi:hypothetical protein